MSTQEREERIRRALYQMTLLDFVTILLKNERLLAENEELKKKLSSKEEKA